MAREELMGVWMGFKALPMVMWQKVSSWLSTFQAANCETIREGVLPTPRWSPPSQGWVKINTDRAVKGHTNMGGVGVVLWDWRGGFLAAGEQQFPRVTSVPLLELFAVRYGLQVAQLQGFQQVVVESD
ncbi:hypothetical protein C1H46_023902 [Malus baccata]|uniref:RNase H type-1 domain-containing protein n=1 Tax=Malus baccata TaxID=106549 RepID=A0A540LW06_MALBA|nr:hypothetical protein C1H46_023902 [Malus baccata]